MERRGKNMVQAGERFGRLLTVEEAGRDKHKNIFWLCKCNCGRVCKIRATTLAKGHTRSCGCFRKEKFHEIIYKHGLRKNRLYTVWAIMRQRCYNPKASGYKNYGGRGITVCESWKSFVNFYNDMSGTYRKGLSIERVDNDGNYCPENCRWATKSEQARNKRKNIVH